MDSYQDLNNISEIEPLTSQEIERLFRQGDRYFYKEEYDRAIEIFEKLLKSQKIEDSLFFNLRRKLVKAYQHNDRLEQAIELCKLMVQSDCNAASLWGTKYMENLVSQDNVATNEPEESSESIDVIPNQFKFKTLSQFKQYCQDNLLEQLKELEKSRIQTLITIVISGIICLVFNWCICQLIINYIGSVDNTFILNLALLTFPGSIWIIFCRGCIHVYGMGFKRNIIASIVNFIDEDKTLNYANKLFLEDKRPTILGFTRSQIFRDELEEPDALEQEDCVYGSIGNTDIFFAEIIVEDYYHRYLNEFEDVESIGKKRIFHGLFFEARFPKDFMSRTFILPKNLKNQFNSTNSWRGENIKLEDPNFQQIFQVYGDNQVESRYILSTSLMSRLVEFRRKAKRPVYLSFVDGFVYIAIPYRYNLFEPKLLQSMMSFAPLREYFLDLQLMIGIVNDLNLNRRIWGKN